MKRFLLLVIIMFTMHITLLYIINAEEDCLLEPIVDDENMLIDFNQLITVSIMLLVKYGVPIIMLYNTTCVLLYHYYY